MSAKFIKGYTLAMQPTFSKRLRILILLYLSFFFHLKRILYDFFSHSAQEFQGKSQITKTNKMTHFSIPFAFFMKTIGFSTVFIVYMNSACKNTLISAFLLHLQISHNFRQFFSKAIPLLFSRFSQKCEKFQICFICLSSILKSYFMTFSDILLKSFSENLK